MESTVRRTPFPLALYWSPKRIDGDMLLRQLILMLGPENQPIATHAAVTIVTTIIVIITTIISILTIVILTAILTVLPIFTIITIIMSCRRQLYQAQNEIYVQLFQTPDEAEEADLACDHIYIVPFKYRKWKLL